MSGRPRVLVIAEAANPEWVSVPLVGWSLARALAGVADVHMVTQVRNRDAIRRAGLVEGRDFTAIDNEAVARPLWALGRVLRMGKGRGWTMLQAMNAAAYPAFERRVWRLFGGDIRAGRWDIVHRVTPLSPTISSPLAPLCARAGVPFVLGPLNGGVPWPRAFRAEMAREREFLALARGAYKLLPGRGRTLRAAAAIIAGSRHTAGEIGPRFAHKVVHLPENAVDPARFDLEQAVASAPAAGGPLRVAFVGRMVPYKGPDMLIEAARPLLQAGRMTLEMIGDGPLLEELRARPLPGLTFHGWVAHERVSGLLARAQVMALPSVREFGGGVVLEAMALGVVPLVVDYAGPGELVREGLGLKVALGTRGEVIAGFRAVLARLADDPAPLAGMARAGRAHVARHFTWQAKAREVARVYDWVLGRGERPVPGWLREGGAGGGAGEEAGGDGGA